MQARRRSVLGVIALGLVQVACLSRSIVPDESVPEVEPPVQEKSKTLEGDWIFQMGAASESIVQVHDVIESEWLGQFKVNAGGRIVGEGTGTYKAEIYAVDDEGCGTKWTVAGDDASFTFFLSNTINLTGDTVPLRIDVSEVNIPAVEGKPTCEDTPTRDYPGYTDIHINNLLRQIAGDATIIARKLPTNCALTDRQGKTAATIRVTKFGLPPEEQDDLGLETLSTEIQLAPLAPCD